MNSSQKAPLATFPTESSHFKVRYKTSMGVTLVVIGLIALFLNLWVMLLSGAFNIGIISGIAPTFIGILYLKRPYFVIAPNRLTIYAPIGKVVKRYTFGSFNDLKVIKDKLYVESDDAALTGAEKVKVSRMLIHNQDWRAIKQMASRQA